MLHVRGTAGDYHGWAEEVSDSSWNSTFMSKMEDKYESFVNLTTRTTTSVHWDISERCESYRVWCSAGLQRVDLKFVRVHVYRHASKNGVRQSSARQMLLPQMKTSTNLHVLTNAHVQKLNFEGKKVTSVRVSHGDEVFDIKARHEVILCWCICESATSSTLGCWTEGSS